jgi:Zn-dependent alcohol dehydrogenase
MKAAILTGPGPMIIDDVTLDGPGPGEVRVKLTACGVCHSDLLPIHAARGPGLPNPVILGHEAAGVVEAVGAGVRSVAEGDSVICAFRPGCGACFACSRVRAGTRNCANNRTIRSGLQTVAIPACAGRTAPCRRASGSAASPRCA